MAAGGGFACGFPLKEGREGRVFGALDPAPSFGAPLGKAWRRSWTVPFPPLPQGAQRRLGSFPVRWVREKRPRGRASLAALHFRAEGPLAGQQDAPVEAEPRKFGASRRALGGRGGFQIGLEASKRKEGGMPSPPCSAHSSSGRPGPKRLEAALAKTERDPPRLAVGTNCGRFC